MRTRLTAITLLLLAATTAFAQSQFGEVSPNWTQPTQPGVGWDSGIYRYDGSGNIARIGDDTFAYDGANRLAASTIHAYRAKTTQSFQYDRYGNVLGVVTDIENGSDPRITEPSTLTVNAQTNQLVQLCRGTLPCVPWTYDDAGNQTAHGSQVTYKWDAAGAMTELTGSVAHERYVYDANDERVLIVTLDGESEVARRWTWRDASNKVAREAVEHVGTNVWSDARDYVYRDGSLLASFESSAAPIAERHYHLDHLGTPRLITDASRNKRAAEVYLAFGEEAAGGEAATIGFTDRMRFTGHERDGDGSPYRPTLDYMHARYYTAEGKRFLAADPGKDWDPGQPQSWNLYAYVRNNPVKSFDPNGRRVVSQGPAVTLKQNHVAVSIAGATNYDDTGNMSLTVTFGIGLSTSPAGGGVAGTLAYKPEGTVETVVGTSYAVGGALGPAGVDIGIDSNTLRPDSVTANVDPIALITGARGVEAQGMVQHTVEIVNMRKLAGFIGTKLGEAIRDVREMTDELAKDAVEKLDSARKLSDELIEKYDRNTNQ